MGELATPRSQYEQVGLADDRGPVQQWRRTEEELKANWSRSPISSSSPADTRDGAALDLARTIIRRRTPLCAPAPEKVIANGEMVRLSQPAVGSHLYSGAVPGGALVRLAHRPE